MTDHMVRTRVFWTMASLGVDLASADGLLPSNPRPEASQKLTQQSQEEEVASDDEELEDVEETVVERLVGLTEMVPDSVWSVTGRSVKFSYWLVRRSAWVIGTSLALLTLPAFIEQQRIEFEDMQNMQKKQMMLGHGATMPSHPMTMPPGPRPA